MIIVKKIISLILTIALLFNVAPTAFTASTTNFYTTQELIGYAGRVYLTVHEDVPVRSAPHNKGTVLDRLPKGFPVEAVGLFRTWKGTM